jgi:FSR family fosmidomycin resistance protein-like MFS transporter
VGRLSDGVGRKPVIVLSMLGGAGGVGVAAFAGNSVLLVAAVIFAATLLVSVRPALLAAAVEMVGRREVTSLGLIYAVMDGVGALGALLAGLAGGTDLRYSFAFVAGAAVLASVIAAAQPFAVASSSRQSPASAEQVEEAGA